MTSSEKPAKKAEKGSGKIGTESYKGVRDFYPEDMFIEQFMFNKMREATEKFGYVEYSASILEPSELYKGKTSEEIVNEQTYTFTDRGEREVTLRPEMTPSVARMVAAHKRELSFPLRWYSIPNVFRYEKPQRGRLREHWQLNADIFGDSSTEAEVEIIALTHSVFTNFAAKQADFEILINSRKALNELWQKIDIEDGQRKNLTRLIDTKEKISAKDFLVELEKLVGAKAKDVAGALESATPTKEIADVINKLKALGIENVKFVPTLTRGFDYYTGIVFEVFDTNKENRRSLAGGGRYDDLLSMFGSESVPAVGCGLGDVTLRDFLESHDLLPEYTSPTKLFIATITESGSTSESDSRKNSENIKNYANTFAQKLRANGVSVVVDHTNRTVGDRIKKALKDKVAYFTAIGQNEIETQTLTVKSLQTKEEQKISIDSISELKFN